MIVPPWVYAAGAAGLLGVGFAAGWTVQGWRWSAADADRLEAEVAAKDERIAKLDDISTDYEAGREKGRVEYITREGQVRTIYETVEVPANCAAPDGVRRVLSEAVTSANSPPGQSGG